MTSSNGASKFSSRWMACAQIWSASILLCGCKPGQAERFWGSLGGEQAPENRAQGDSDPSVPAQAGTESAPSCWHDGAAEDRVDIVVRSANLEQCKLRSLDDFAEVVKIGRAEFDRSVGPGLWALQEAVPNDLDGCSGYGIHCLGVRFSEIYEDRTASWFKHEDHEVDVGIIVGNPWLIDDHGVYMEGRHVLRTRVRHRDQLWPLRIYNIHGHHHCSEDHAHHRRRQVEAVLNDLRTDPPNKELPPIFIGDFNAIVHPAPDDEQPCRKLDLDTYALLEQHFTLVSLPAWSADKLGACGVPADGGVDQVWIARPDVYDVNGELIPLYVRYNDLANPGSNYCDVRRSESGCPTNPKNHGPCTFPETPCIACLSDHSLVSMAFEITGSRCIPECPGRFCGTDGCGGFCQCGSNEKCVQKRCVEQWSDECTKAGDKPCWCNGGCMSESSCRAACG